MRDAPYPDLVVLVIPGELLPPFLLAAGSPHAPWQPAPAPVNQKTVPATVGLAGRVWTAAGGAASRLRRRLPLVGAAATGGAAAAAAEAAAAVGVLTELQRAVAVAKAFGLGVLLAVASPEPLGAATRRRLAASVGLGGSPGAVVPVLLWPPQLMGLPQLPAEGLGAGAGTAQPSMGSATQKQQQQQQADSGQQQPGPAPEVRLLQAALYAHATARYEEWAAGLQPGWARARL